jgi:hypothetical protein
MGAMAQKHVSYFDSGHHPVSVVICRPEAQLRIQTDRRFIGARPTALRQHAGRRCGTGAMCRWAMVSRLSQIGTGRPNRRRTLRLISASVGSVGKGVATAVLSTLRGRAAPVTAQTGSYRQISGNWPRASTQVTPIDPSAQACDAQNLGHDGEHAVGFPIRPNVAKAAWSAAS